MAFNNNKIRSIEKIFNVDRQTCEKILKHQAKYLKLQPTKLLNSYYAVVKREITEYAREQAKKKKLYTKNPLIAKYKEEIRELYELEGYGYLKISRALKINHNANISKSAIENFIKQNELVKGGKSG